MLAQQPFAHGRLKVSDNKRYLVHQDGTPFFWLGDTTWELFHRLTREEADQYLKRRAEQGYTVVQAVALAEFDGLKEPNPYGDTPLLNDNPTTPNDAYFRHVDYIVDKAAQYGIVIAFLPTWGIKYLKAPGARGRKFSTRTIRRRTASTSATATKTSRTSSGFWVATEIRATGRRTWQSGGPWHRAFRKA
ncbi:hypothetical protein GCM10028773_07680 [Spirosoma koreense]